MRDLKIVLIAIFLAACAVLSFARPVYADCTGPSASEGTLEYFSASDVFRFCDGANWQEMGTVSETPGYSFLFQDTGETCTDANEGLITYVSSGQMQICLGAAEGWRTFYYKDPCGAWQADTALTGCSGTSSAGSQPDRDACQALCESEGRDYCGYNSGSQFCQRVSGTCSFTSQSGAEAVACD